MEGLSGHPAARARAGRRHPRPGQFSQPGAELTAAAAPSSGPAPGASPSPGAARGPQWAGAAPQEVVRLLLWRHGQTDYNVERRFQGQTDIPLNAVGHRQAKNAAALIAALAPAAIYSSDLSRAAVTAAALAERTGLTVQYDKDLRERFGGAWEGLDDKQMKAGFPEAYARWDPPGGEPVSAVAERVCGVMERIAGEAAGGGLVVLVSHGAALGMGLSRLLGVSPERRLLGPLGNCCWSVAGRRAGTWRLLTHNTGVPDEPAGPPPAEEAPAAETPDLAGGRDARAGTGG